MKNNCSASRHRSRKPPVPGTPCKVWSWSFISSQVDFCQEALFSSHAPLHATNHRLHFHPLCLVLPWALPCHVPPAFISSAVGALEQVSPLHYTLLPAAARCRASGSAKHCPEISVRSMISCWSWQSVEVLLTVMAWWQHKCWGNPFSSIKINLTARNLTKWIKNLKKLLSY